MPRIPWLATLGPGLILTTVACDGEDPSLDDFTVYPRALAIHDEVKKVECACYLDDSYDGPAYFETVDECVESSRPIPESELPCVWRAYENDPNAEAYLDCYEARMEVYVQCAASMACEPSGVALSCRDMFYLTFTEMCPFPESLRESTGRCKDQV